MATRFVGIKELRQNMAKISKEAQKKNERLIILRKNRPIFELRPLTHSDALTETFRKDIEEARASAHAGNVYTHDEARKKLGL